MLEKYTGSGFGTDLLAHLPGETIVACIEYTGNTNIEGRKVAIIFASGFGISVTSKRDHEQSDPIELLHPNEVLAIVNGEQHIIKRRLRRLKGLASLSLPWALAAENAEDET